VLSAYRPLFARAEARRLVAASLLARLPIASVDLPLILLAVQATGSYATAGLALGVRAAAVAVTAPARGRVIDTHGSRRVVPPLVAVGALATAGLSGAAALEAGWLIVVLAGVEGAFAPALPAAMRLEWQRLLAAEPKRLEQAYAFESSAQVGLYVVGPLLAGAGVAVAGASATVLGVAAALLAGGLAFAALAHSAPSADRPAGRGLGPLRMPGVLTLVVAITLADVGLGVVDVSVVAFAKERGEAGVAGVLLAVFALSSITGSALYGARTWRSPPERRLVLVLAVGAVTALPLALADSLLALGCLLAVAGTSSAAQLVTASIALDRVTPPGMGAEAYNWLSTANALGVALGATLAGALVETSGTAAAFLAGAAGLALAGCFTAWRVYSCRDFEVRNSSSP
jgi:MFS family permease